MGQRPKAALSFGLSQHQEKDDHQHQQQHQQHYHQVGFAPDLTSPSSRSKKDDAGTSTGTHRQHHQKAATASSSSPGTRGRGGSGGKGKRTSSGVGSGSNSGASQQQQQQQQQQQRPTSRQAHGLSSARAVQETTDAEGRNVKLKHKSNKQLMRNALTHTCLAGYVDKDVLELALSELDASTGAHYIILLHDPNDIKYRAVYSFDIEEGKGFKVAGRGPSTLKASRITTYFRYNSGKRTFTAMGTSQVSQMVDAVCVQKVAKKRPTSNQPYVINGP